MPQLPLQFQSVTDYSPAAWVPLACQQAAVAALRALPTLGQWGAVVVGPAGSGKTHLAALWLSWQNHPAAVAIDDVHALDAAGQEALFHQFNTAQAAHTPLLITSAQPLAVLPILPDLKTRLLTLPQVEIFTPTEADWQVLLTKWAADLQLDVAPQVLAYLVNHAPRHPAQLRALLHAADLRALAQHSKISVAVVKDLLAEAGNMA